MPLAEARMAGGAGVAQVSLIPAILITPTAQGVRSLGQFVKEQVEKGVTRAFVYAQSVTSAEEGGRSGLPRLAGGPSNAGEAGKITRKKRKRRRTMSCSGHPLHHQTRPSITFGQSLVLILVRSSTSVAIFASTLMTGYEMALVAHVSPLA